MSFKEMVEADNHAVFMNDQEFAGKRTVIYNGKRYKNIPIVLTGLKEKNRLPRVNDHAQGLFLVTSVMRCTLSDLGGRQPEKGQRIKINDRKGGKFFNEFNVASSVCEMGMLRVELEAIDE